MTRERRLGRGLAALLGEEAEPVSVSQVSAAQATALKIHRPEEDDDASADLDLDDDIPPAAPLSDSTPTSVAPEAASAKDGDLLLLSVYDIDDNPFQPRRDFSESEIASLAESLKEHDMLQPVLVRRNGARWQLISGERRLRAAIQAGWSQVPARVRQADDRLVAELAIVENLQRKDLNAIEKALSFRRYLDQHQCTQEDLGKRLKIDRSTIANLMRLLELPEKVQNEIQSGSISMGHARALLPLGEEELQIKYSQQIQREGWSVRETERRVADYVAEADGNGGSTRRQKPPRSNHIASLEQTMRIQLGTKVDIKEGARGRGQIVIHFKNAVEFERLKHLIDEATNEHQERFAG